MRPLGITLKGVTEAGANINYKITQSTTTMSRLLQVWNEWEIQLMVLTSFALQLFLLVTGNLRRRRINGLLRLLIWLAYVGADLVAVYALGLFSQYEDKYRLGRHSYGDTLPFLWVPFLLLHLGGQDSITAFSMEDNNLWLRHLLNLGIQVALALYVFWKSFPRIHSLVLTPSILVFVSGIIKYGERTWALNSGSRDGLGTNTRRLSRWANTPPDNEHRNNISAGPLERQENSRGSVYSYACQTTLLARGLFVGRTILQLGKTAYQEVIVEFGKYKETGEKLGEIIVMELGMMFDLLYTKAMVLQRWRGIIFRSISQISMAVAFVLFVWNEKHAHNTVNVVISYTLFIGAMLMEICSVGVVLASPWTKALSQEGSFLYRISSICAWFLSKAIQRNKKQWLSNSLAQYNLMDCCIASKSTHAVVVERFLMLLGLDQKWRMLWRIKHTEGKGIVEHIVKLFGNEQPQQENILGLFRKQPMFGRKLNYTLCLPFEHALFRLHIYTDLYISGALLMLARLTDEQVRSLKDDCEKLSNYMTYLMEVCPSMLPVSTAAQDIGPRLRKWVKECDETTKHNILKAYANERLVNKREPDSASPFGPAQELQDGNTVLMKQSLEGIKGMWVKLLIYAAGKCPGEVHVRQLGNGGELLTFVWLLMLHHGLGDAATEIKLLTSDDPNVPQHESLVSVDDGSWAVRPGQPYHAFHFHGDQQQGSPHRPQPETAGGLHQSLERQVMEHLLSRIMEQGEVTTRSRVAEQHETRTFSAAEVDDQNEATPRAEVIMLALAGHNLAPLLRAVVAGAQLQQDEAGTSSEAARRGDDDAETQSEIHEVH